MSELIYDPLTDGPDVLADYLSSITCTLSLNTRPTTDKIAADWIAKNSSVRTLICINCGSRTLLQETGFCTACGAEGDDESSALVEELEMLAKKYNEIRRNQTNN